MDPLALPARDHLGRLYVRPASVAEIDRWIQLEHDRRTRYAEQGDTEGAAMVQGLINELLDQRIEAVGRAPT